MTTTTPIKKIVIAGGGTAGWMAAAALVKLLGKTLSVTLIESDEIGTVGVGEATIPSLVFFHQLLGINEQAFMSATQGTFKLGIQFENWRKLDHRYIHAFGVTGKDCWAAGFQHFWLKGLEKGFSADFGDYCLERRAAEAHRFAHLPKNGLNYAFHMDATQYAQFLKQLSLPLGVERIEGKIQRVNTDNESGFIRSLSLNDDRTIEGDFFIDCTGFRGLLIEQALHTGYEDWSHWLPCDSAVAVQTESVAPPLPFTRSIAHDAGWQWRIPLQHRVGNGLVFCSKYLGDEQAKALLARNIEGKVLTEPRVIKFKTGRRLKQWNKNCVALGLASGFLEPLESTSIHLIQQGIVRLLRMFPHHGVRQVDIDEYNKQTDFDVEHIRDFIILHYHATERDDSPFWNYCRQMKVPDSLAHRIQLFKETGRVFRDGNELFDDSWQQVMIGQGVMPEQYHPIVNTMPDGELKAFLEHIRSSIDKTVERLPSHQEYLNQYCPGNR
ncbi:tryptophan halogenase family protein [Permianibacter aggregans]|uniref:Tryptophan halogenase n=1 Tax=Permianibacter aggregans TaxID=1510150 RepID=A0A4R6V587_9GAMM|nr:tryptophan halogenase family protein [Permianibacter aggregans]QGX41543.1 tryptophan 7-halogenase [Permianibacter aggregans]TDQ51344.1 tryptophan halogenase [Permianibacter aggregans]